MFYNISIILCFRRHFWQFHFGGVTSFTPEQYHLVNGFSNEFYGYGQEDVDMFYRVRKAGLSIQRYPQPIARYTMIKHERDAGNPKAEHRT